MTFEPPSVRAYSYTPLPYVVFVRKYCWRIVVKIAFELTVEKMPVYTPHSTNSQKSDRVNDDSRQFPLVGLPSRRYTDASARVQSQHQHGSGVHVQVAPTRMSS